MTWMTDIAEGRWTDERVEELIDEAYSWCCPACGEGRGDCIGGDVDPYCGTHCLGCGPCIREGCDQLGCEGIIESGCHGYSAGEVAEYNCMAEEEWRNWATDPRNALRNAAQPPLPGESAR